jgi:hypothetical protein
MFEHELKKNRILEGASLKETLDASGSVPFLGCREFAPPGRDWLGNRHPNAKLRFAKPFQTELGIQEFVSLAAPTHHFVPDKLAAIWFCFRPADIGKNLVGLRVAELDYKTESFWQ